MSDDIVSYTAVSERAVSLRDSGTTRVRRQAGASNHHFFKLVISTASIWVWKVRKATNGEEYYRVGTKIAATTQMNGQILQYAHRDCCRPCMLHAHTQPTKY